MKRFAALLISSPDDSEAPPVRVSASPSIEIGSSPTLVKTGIAISLASVSSRHAELRFTPKTKTWSIRDTNSERGTYVDGQRITNWYELQFGSRIRFGSAEAEFIFQPKEESVPLPIIPVVMSVGLLTAAVAAIVVSVPSIVIPFSINRKVQQLSQLHENQDYQQCYETAEELNPEAAPELATAKIQYIGDCGFGWAESFITNAETPDYSAAIAQAQKVAAADPDHGKAAQSKIDQWSQQWLTHAQNAYGDQGELSQLENAATGLPDGPWRDQAQGDLEELRQVDQQLKAAQTAANNRDWLVAKEQAAPLQANSSTFVQTQAEDIIFQADKAINLENAYQDKRYQNCYDWSSGLDTEGRQVFEELKADYSLRCGQALAQSQAEVGDLAAAITTAQALESKDPEMTPQINNWSTQLVSKAETAYQDKGDLEPLRQSLDQVPSTTAAHGKATQSLQTYEEIDGINRPLVVKADQFLDNWECGQAETQVKMLKDVEQFPHWQAEKQRLTRDIELCRTPAPEPQWQPAPEPQWQPAPEPQWQPAPEPQWQPAPEPSGPIPACQLINDC
jgi:pSer/pThr/pTyr-binding forkhead associated (FHA) protein